MAYKAWLSLRKFKKTLKRNKGIVLMSTDGKKVAIKIVDGKLVILVDTNQDGEASLKIECDLQEVVDETGLLKKIGG